MVLLEGGGTLYMVGVRGNGRSLGCGWALNKTMGYQVPYPVYPFPSRAEAIELSESVFLNRQFQVFCFTLGN